MKTCCGNRCSNQFEGPGCLCPGCRQRNEPRLRPVPKIEELVDDENYPLILLAGALASRRRRSL